MSKTAFLLQVEGAALRGKAYTEASCAAIAQAAAEGLAQRPTQEQVDEAINAATGKIKAGDARAGHIASATAPADTGLLWIDTTENKIKYHNGSVWVAVT